jgi:hypothetical protein
MLDSTTIYTNNPMILTTIQMSCQNSQKKIKNPNYRLWNRALNDPSYRIGI